LLKTLEAILHEYPEVAHERHENGYTLLHFASLRQSPEFCKRLLDLNVDAVKSQSDIGALPIHYACRCNNVETAQYLFELYPESINVIDSNRRYPVHYLLYSGVCTELVLKLAQFLLQHDEGAVTKRDSGGYLPLHLAIRSDSLHLVKLVYNAYPQAIYWENYDGSTPLRLARNFNSRPLVHFLESQLELVRQATEEVIPDIGRLPLHRAILSRNMVPIGTIKLMVAANPISVRARDVRGLTPLHLACQTDNIEVIKCLMDADQEALEVQDLGGNCPLHHACFAGLINVVNCILDASDHGVSVRNTDGKLPIQLLVYDDECDRNSSEYFGRVSTLERDENNANSFEYVDTFYRLLRAYPAIHEIFVINE
jgi:ankyrin repeat protein